MSGFSGPGIARQRSLVASLRACPALAERMVGVASEAAEKQYRAGFASSTDPYGSGWAPTQSGGPTLYKTGALANPTVVVEKGRFRLRSESYGAFAQHGWHPGHSRASLLKESRSLLGESRPGKGSTSAERRAFRSKLALGVRSLRASLTASGTAMVPPRRIQPSGGDPGRWGVPMRKACSEAVVAHFGGKA